LIFFSANWQKIKMLINKYLSNIPGWRTRKKYVIIESDDWGSIRMPSNEAYNNLIKAGIDLDNDEGRRFNKYDTLATSADLSLLFEVLGSVKDSTNRTAVMTPVSVVANPDFKKISESDFKEYHYESFTETLLKYPGSENSFNIWKEGIQKRLFVPQFHGREHLNVQSWLKALQAENEKVMVAFQNQMWGISTANDPEIKLELQAAFDFHNQEDLIYQESVIASGLDLFEDLFGFRATYFVPPNGPFSTQLEKVCRQKGIKYIAVSKIQQEPVGGGKFRKNLHWLGQSNKSGILYLTRNCHFEPSQEGRDWVDSCLRDISIAFSLFKPAVVSSHRVNYIGALWEHNRSGGLKQLNTLLNTIIKKWPDTEFITSSELGNLILYAE